MRVAYLQLHPKFGDKEHNLLRAAEMMSRHPAELYVLPELFNTGYLFKNRLETAEAAETVPDGPTSRRLEQLAKNHACYVVAGMAEKCGEKIFNSAVLIGPAGHAATYHKIHLFDEEKNCFDAGDRPFAVHDIGPAKIGMMICFDWIFPEAMRSLALQGAEIICHPANLVLPYCQRAMKTRCLENGLFAVTANRIGVERHKGRRLRFTGGSQITGPRGEILQSASKNREEAGAFDVEPHLTREKWLTERNHLLQDRRPLLYYPRSDEGGELGAL